MKNLTFDLTERVKQIIEYYGLNPYSMSVKISVSEGTIRKFLAGQIGMKVETLTKILTIFDDISADWLILGKGEMLRENCKNAPARAYEFGEEHPGMNASESNGHQRRINSESTPSQLRDDTPPSWERYNNALIEVGILRERLARASVTIATLQRQLSTEREKTPSSSAPTDSVVTLV